LSFANSAMTAAHEVSAARELINVAEKQQRYSYRAYDCDILTKKFEIEISLT